MKDFSDKIFEGYLQESIDTSEQAEKMEKWANGTRPCKIDLITK